MDLTSFTDAELTDLQMSLQAEKDRRAAQPHVDGATTELVSGLINSGAVAGPEASDEDTPEADVKPWANPGTDHLRMYHKGMVTKHADRIWLSEHPFLNFWEPGSEGVDSRIWRDITPVPEPEEGEEPAAPEAWVQPAGSHDAYKVGEEVTFDGGVYRSKIDNNTWSPADYPSGWQLLP